MCCQSFRCYLFNRSLLLVQSFSDTCLLLNYVFQFFWNYLSTLDHQYFLKGVLSVLCIVSRWLSLADWAGFLTPAVGTNWPFCVDVPVNNQSVSPITEINVAEPTEASTIFLTRYLTGLVFSNQCWILHEVFGTGQSRNRSVLVAFKTFIFLLIAFNGVNAWGKSVVINQFCIFSSLTSTNVLLFYSHFLVKRCVDGWCFEKLWPLRRWW